MMPIPPSQSKPHSGRAPVPHNTAGNTALGNQIGVANIFNIASKFAAGGNRGSDSADATMRLSDLNNCIAANGSHSPGKLTSGMCALVPSKTGCSSFSPSSATLSITKDKTRDFAGMCP